MQQQAEIWLREILGPEAAFRPGQWEAIEGLVARRQRMLVVQRTGWGKSSVYFLATRLLRQQGRGVTVLISPLLALMRNQIETAQRWGVRAASINSSNSSFHRDIENEVLRGEVDLLLISPERLANARFQDRIWSQLREQIGMLVIDEAHCISDWGHDFRPNYRRIMSVLNDLPDDTPVLGTTATANDRVVEDVSDIIGTMNILRGPLTRESLRLYVYPDAMDGGLRLTLLSHLLRSIRGCGIIYCTTTRDCQQVAGWLQNEGYNVKPYYSKVEEDIGETRAALEQQLLGNQVKALVASVALGMGFDKPDLHFVVHYQLPGNIINYYQQIGRAGRGIDTAHIILMHGAGDEDIQQYFINTAFPTPEQVRETTKVLRQLQRATRSDLQRDVNVRYGILEKILTHLEVEGMIEREGSEYRLVNGQSEPDYQRWAMVTQRRYEELNQMQRYTQHNECLMHFIAHALDDPQPVERCGRCKNCMEVQSHFEPDVHEVERAQRYLRGGAGIPLSPRKRWPKGLPGIKKTTELKPMETGVAVSHYYEAGWGSLVKADRVMGKAYRDELLEVSTEVLQEFMAELRNKPQWITCVPSQRTQQLVPNFAERLAEKLELPFKPVVTHLKQHPPQETMHNSYQQAQNVYRAYGLVATRHIPKTPVLLIDDLADSKWTLTGVGHLLRTANVRAVYPFVLATTGA